MDTHFSSFTEFWPYYVAQHLHPANRALHFIGTSGVVICLAAGFMFTPLWFLAMPIAGYGFAWVGHFSYERNRPATFTHPLWSLRGDFRMYLLMWMGRMDPEVQRAATLFPAGA